MLSTTVYLLAYTIIGKTTSILFRMNKTQKACRQACNMSMLGMPDNAKRYLGFSSYVEAHDSWDAFHQNATLPPTLPALSPRHIAIAQSLRQKMLERYAAQAAAVLRLPPLNTPLAGPSRIRSAPTPVTQVPLLSPAQPGPAGRAHLAGSQSSATRGSSHSESTGNGFWVVIGGPTPGVFNDRYAFVPLTIY